MNSRRHGRTQTQGQITGPCGLWPGGLPPSAATDPLRAMTAGEGVADGDEASPGGSTSSLIALMSFVPPACAPRWLDKDEVLSLSPAHCSDGPPHLARPRSRSRVVQYAPLTIV